MPRATFDGAAFVERHGVVLASARGPVPSLAEAVAGGPIKGSWWAHAKGDAIFRVLSAVEDAPDIKCFKLVDGKVTFVHRRLWPALVRLAAVLGEDRLGEVRQEHTASGKHVNHVTPFPAWVAADVRAAAAALTDEAARAALGAWVDPPGRKKKR